MKHSSKIFILKHRRIKKIKNKEIYIRKAIKMSNLSENRRKRERESSKAMLKEKMIKGSQHVTDA